MKVFLKIIKINLLLMLVNLALGAVNIFRGNYLVGAFGISVALFIFITNFRQSTHTILGYLAFFLLLPIVWIVLKAWDIFDPNTCPKHKTKRRFSGYHQDRYICDLCYKEELSLLESLTKRKKNEK